MVFPNRRFIVVKDVLTELMKTGKKKGTIKELIGSIIRSENEKFTTSGFNPILRGSNQDQIEIMTELSLKYCNLDSGELACIAYVLERDDTRMRLLIDDRKAIGIARELGIKTYTLPGILFYLKKKGLVDNMKLKEIILKLDNEDNYIFAEDVQKLLLK